MVVVVEIERRSYGPESTDAERDAIRAGVYAVADGVVMVKPPPVDSVFTVDLVFDRLAEITAAWGSYTHVVDLVGCDRPSSRVRRRIVERLRENEGRVTRIIAITGKNVVIRAAARLVFGRSKSPVSVCATEGEALELAEAHE